ncbi:uncharacterized protein LOC134265332 [Saccostrea cucullata]|uniref:uncharacterized protein LOC134265332 n=1 Tax=Saccostrea cuccullata TaxID=36930 RepID=UPI002ED65329
MDPKVQCFNCWATGHRKQQCKKGKVYRVYREPVHTPGSTECRHYVDTSDVSEMVVFQGKYNPLSNLYPCEISVFGEKHKSAEHADQLTKAIRAGDLEAAKKVREADTALEAKGLGHTISDPLGWNNDKETLMEEISGTGFDSEAILHTDHKKWPGQNKLGKIYQKLASKHARKLRSSSLPRKGTSENQSNIEDFLKDVKKGRTKNTSVNSKSDAG